MVRRAPRTPVGRYASQPRGARCAATVTGSAGSVAPGRGEPEATQIAQAVYAQDWANVATMTDTLVYGAAPRPWTDLVPAADAEFPLFDDVLADIGDHQSLQESLSTFSAHIVAIRAMLEHATPDSLVLIDELVQATH